MIRLDDTRVHAFLPDDALNDLTPDLKAAHH